MGAEVGAVDWACTVSARLVARGVAAARVPGPGGAVGVLGAGVGAPPNWARAVPMAGRPAVAAYRPRLPQTASSASTRQPPSSTLRVRCEAVGAGTTASMRVVAGIRVG